MLTLAIDSCSSVAGCALVRDGRLLTECYLDSDKTHSHKLLPLVENMLRAADVNISDIELFACTVGPGSFTGQRIGIATVKGLAHALGRPCVGVSALEVMAYNVAFTDKIIAPIMDARRLEVYNGLYRWDGAELLTLAGERAITLSDLLSELRGRQAVFVGDGVFSLRQHLDGFDIAPPHLSQIRASAVGVLAQGKERGSCYDLLPIYLKQSQAERERAQSVAKECAD